MVRHFKAQKNSKDKSFLRRALRGVSKERFLSTVGTLKWVKHVILLSQVLVAFKLMKSNERKLAEEDQSILMVSEIPCTIIRAGLL
ncbi:hypothetical protein AQUCO_01400754v1 [Aquilegia coerulea]|uniref:Uncharacterized protein n=1 Tax=Aquilegia coerulea TaxID=218851 RepID=A0A2G5DXX0_AQUCA|nr:hypothetical protein AQUCO_01400754v1 [Aquilegia coerulea]